MTEWDALTEEEELGVQVSQILNESDDLETLMFGCAHCALGECIWLVKRRETNATVLEAFPFPTNPSLDSRVNWMVEIVRDVVR
jgi:hypothetical protein